MKIHQAVNLSQFSRSTIELPKKRNRARRITHRMSRIACRASKRKPHCVGGDSNRPKRRDAPSWLVGNAHAHGKAAALIGQPLLCTRVMQRYGQPPAPSVR